MTLPNCYYIATPLCSRSEIQIYQLEDKVLHVVHPEGLGLFICCMSSTHKMISYRQEIDLGWLKSRFRASLVLGALPMFPRNRRS